MCKKILGIALVVAMLTAMLSGCGKKKSPQALEDKSSQTGNSDVSGGEQGSENPLEDSIFDGEGQQDAPTPNQQGNTQQPDPPKPTPEPEPEKPLNSENSSDKENDPDQPLTNEKPTPGSLTYEQFKAMTPTEQRRHQEAFDSIDAFFAWYSAAKEKYDAENPPIDVGNGTIDKEDLLNGKK